MIIIIIINNIISSFKHFLDSEKLCQNPIEIQKYLYIYIFLLFNTEKVKQKKITKKIL